VIQSRIIVNHGGSCCGDSPEIALDVGATKSGFCLELKAEANAELDAKSPTGLNSESLLEHGTELESKTGSTCCQTR
jgi:hypothetical protein